MCVLEANKKTTLHHFTNKTIFYELENNKIIFNKRKNSGRGGLLLFMRCVQNGQRKKENKMLLKAGEDHYFKVEQSFVNHMNTELTS